MSGLVRNPEDRFLNVMGHIMNSLIAVEPIQSLKMGYLLIRQKSESETICCT